MSSAKHKTFEETLREEKAVEKLCGERKRLIYRILKGLKD